MVKLVLLEVRLEVVAGDLLSELVEVQRGVHALVLRHQLSAAVANACQVR